MITDTQALFEWKVRAMAQPAGRTVLDLEADSMHRHREKLCLIQYADEQGVTIIDPLAIEDLRLFAVWMEQADVWMHGADYDMNLLQSAFGTLPHLILDTQIAARLLGFRQFGLAALVEHFFDITLSKKNQKADWGLRPMTESMKEYAQGDVKYMLSMADILVERLKKAGRYDWFIESCELQMQKGRERHLAADSEPWRIKGSGNLEARGLAALRELWNWRNDEAALWDRPAFMVCGNEELIRWSLALQEFRTIHPPHHFHAHRAARFRRAVEHFQLLDEDDYPQPPKRTRHETDPEFEERLEHWQKRRNTIAQTLDLEPCIIATRSQLESIAADYERGMSKLMNWQRNLLQH